MVGTADSRYNQTLDSGWTKSKVCLGGMGLLTLLLGSMLHVLVLSIVRILFFVIIFALTT